VIELLGIELTYRIFIVELLLTVKNMKQPRYTKVRADHKIMAHPCVITVNNDVEHLVDSGTESTRGWFRRRGTK
jgi:hypothetical protein